MGKINIKQLANHRLINKLYNRYHLHNSTFEYLVSSHWKKYGAESNICINNDGTITCFTGSGFGDLQYTRFIHKISSYLCIFTYLMRLSGRRDIVAMARKIMPALSIIDSYLSYDCFRQICAFRMIKKYLKFNENDKLNVLIISDGYGFLSLLIKVIYPKAVISLIDIGKILLFQCINIQRIFSSCNHCEVSSAEYVASGIEDFIYCPAENLNNFNSFKFNLIISISALQEMNAPTIKRYFDYIRTHAEANNLFYCSSRVSKQLIGGEVVNFFDYPWRSDDRHIIDEEPLFYRYYIVARSPFVIKFSRMHHRLTNLKTQTYSK